MIPREIFTGFAEFQGIVSVNDLWNSSSVPETEVGSSGSPGKFLFYTCMIVTTVLPSLVPPRHIDDCFAIHFLH